MKKNRGFTLIETMITLTVLAIFLVLSINFGLASLKRATFNAAFNKFLSDFYHARQLAAHENRYAGIVFEPDGTAYRIVVQDKIQTLLTMEDVNSYKVNKIVTPMNGEEFFDGSTTTNFAFNSTGIIRAIPVDLDSDPIQFSLTFFKKDNDYIKYSKIVRVYPSGGIKIEDKIK